VNTPAAVVIFAGTYVLVSMRRLRVLPLGRPAAALTGAVLMVLVAGLPREDAYRAIDHDTLALLLGMMGLVAYLAKAGFFEIVAEGLVRRAGTPLRLLLGVGLLSGVASAFLVNDAVCLFLTPVVVLLCVRQGLPFVPFLMAIATCANIGSVATLVGNPQCMILGNKGDLRFTEYALRMAPVAAAALLVNLALLAAYYGRRLRGVRLAPGAPPARRPGFRRAVGVTALVVAGFFAGLPLGWAALAGFAALMVLSREDPGPVLKRTDWSVLLFFAGLFVVVAGFQGTGLADRAWEAVPPPDLGSLGGRGVLTGMLAAGSNVVSNVPIVLIVAEKLRLMGGAGVGWYLAAMATTFAGNLTILGSVANIIVAEEAWEHHELGFWEYFRFGAVSTACTLAVGVLLL